MAFKVIVFLILMLSFADAKKLEHCKWDNRKDISCLTITKTPNSSAYSEIGVSKIIITKEDIINSGAVDTNDALKLIPGLDVFQSGPKGQSTSIFTRGSESNHTLVLLNGIAINDQSVTDGLHDFGQDFIQTIQQIEVYKGSNGAHFGPSAIAGAINFITDIDYKNNFSVNASNFDNNSFDGNFTKITDNGWHLNIKSTNNISKTNSAIAKGTEDDVSKNAQINLNAKKWISDNLKFKSTLYSRKTKSDYDGSATDESGYVSNNKMHAFQSSLERVSKNINDNLTLHYHNYDREYENSGYLDEYESKSLVARGERKIKATNKFSFGYGGEYKYDWGAFENRGSYSQSTKGYMKDFGLFTNVGYKISQNSTLSFYGRTDDHNTTGKNQTYKINFTKLINKYKIGATHSTGLRNPTLYELYGTSSTGFKGSTNINPEKSKTNEFYVEYDLFSNLKLTSTAYKTSVYDQIELDSSWTANENKLIDINQEGLENVLSFNGTEQNFAIFSNFSKSRKTNAQAQNRRPDLSYGANFIKKINSSPLGPFNFSLNYKYTGKYIDWDGSKNSRQKSTNIADIFLTKKLFGTKYSLSITNLTNERYEKPSTYSQNGRQIKLGYKKSF